MSKARHRQAMQTTFRTVRREGDGILQLGIFSVADLPPLTTSAEAGNEYAKRSLHAISNILAEYYGFRGTRRPKLCFCCGGPVACPVAIAIVTALHDDPSVGIAGVICQACDGTRRELEDRVLEVWRANGNPSARRIDIHLTAGRA